MGIRRFVNCKGAQAFGIWKRRRHRGIRTSREMKCFPCFKPEKKMPSRRMERGEVPPANAAVSTRSGAPLEKSGKNRRGCSCHSLAESNEPSSASPKHTQSSENRSNSEPAENSAMAKTAKAFTFRDLATATKNFRFDCLVGEGGFGRVYKGQLENGQVYAGTT